MYLLEEIHAFHEAIFPDDLAVDGNDLIEAGICESAEDAEKMLHMLVERIHLKPNLNTRSKLLDLAKTYKKNKLAAATRGIRWMR
jgi:hypothetical protein